jgi:hypothetical protein
MKQYMGGAPSIAYNASTLVALKSGSQVWLTSLAHKSGSQTKIPADSTYFSI